MSGKSTFRRLLAGMLSGIGLRVKEFDADYEKIPNELNKPENADTIYIIEDVRGLTGKSAIPLSAFNLILYLKPSFISHFIFWTQRMFHWFKNGKFDWKRETGWKGTSQGYDLRNIVPIVRIFLRNFRNRKIWINRDLKVISDSGIPFAVVQSQWKPRAMQFVHLKR